MHHPFVKFCRRAFRHFVCYMAKPIPGNDNSIIWLVVAGALLIGFAWTFAPYAVWHAFNDTPLASATLRHLPDLIFGYHSDFYTKYAPMLVSYILPVIMTLAAFMPLSRALQLLDPDEFDQYNDE